MIDKNFLFFNFRNVMGNALFRFLRSPEWLNNCIFAIKNLSSQENPYDLIKLFLLNANLHSFQQVIFSIIPLQFIILSTISGHRIGKVSFNVESPNWSIFWWHPPSFSKLEQLRYQAMSLSRNSIDIWKESVEDAWNFYFEYANSSLDTISHYYWMGSLTRNGINWQLNNKSNNFVGMMLI